jgi:hypothetical protein
MKQNINPNETNHAKKCFTCEAQLNGRQRKFCSRKCHNRYGNTKHQNYNCQQKRGVERKIKLVKMFGGKCKECGYSKNYAALTFHHKDPSLKSFPLDLRNCSNTKWSTLLEESKKCELLCVRCHIELHNPNFFV